MAEYIDKQAFNDAIREAIRKYPSTFYNGLETSRRIAHDMDAADVQPVRHGRWKPYDLTYGRSIYYCTACNHSAEVPTVLDAPIFNYCPNCGAKMDGGENNIN